jgi:hypothetical protein
VVVVVAMDLLVVALFGRVVPKLSLQLRHLLLKNK